MRHRCVFVGALCFLLGAGSGVTGMHLTGTATMSIDEALMLAGKDLTQEQKDIVSSALRRHGLDLIRALQTLSKDSPYAVLTLERLRQELK